jgi:hypothetical protein
MKTLPRRTLLRGLGASIGLPLLDAMVPTRARASAADDTQPARLVVLYVANGAHMPEWTPAEEGSDFAFKRCLEPLRPWRKRVLMLTGLAQDNGRALGDGPGDHARAMASFLTGMHPVKSGGAGIRAGVSFDQVAAKHLGRHTRLPSLELGIEPGAQSGECDSGYSCAYSGSLAWRSPTLPASKEIDPALVFDRLFGEARSARRDRDRRSILDYVRQDVGQLLPRLGAKDRDKLDEYLTGVRELEQRVASVSRGPTPRLPAFDRPDGPPSDLQEHIRLMLDLMVAAFEADITRVATFLLTNEASNRSYPWLDVPEGHHDLSHHGGNPAKQAKLVRISQFYAEQLGYFLGRLARSRHEGPSLLDQSLVLYGSGLSDGDIHSHENLPILLAGNGAGISSGRHVRAGKTPLCNLLLSLLDQLGVESDKFGDSTGRLNGLVRG